MTGNWLVAARRRTFPHRSLKAAGVPNGLEAEQVTAWLPIRNAVTRGNYGEYDEAAVRPMIEGVGNFTDKYPA